MSLPKSPRKIGEVGIAATKIQQPLVSFSIVPFVVIGKCQRQFRQAAVNYAFVSIQGSLQAARVF